MVMPFLYLKFGLQHSIVKSGGYLADTAAYTVYYLAVKVRARHVITIAFRKRTYRFIGGKGFTWK